MIWTEKERLFYFITFQFRRRNYYESAGSGLGDIAILLFTSPISIIMTIPGGAGINDIIYFIPKFTCSDGKVLLFPPN